MSYCTAGTIQIAPILCSLLAQVQVQGMHMNIQVPLPVVFVVNLPFHGALHLITASFHPTYGT